MISVYSLWLFKGKCPDIVKCFAFPFTETQLEEVPFSWLQNVPNFVEKSLGYVFLEIECL